MNSVNQPRVTFLIESLSIGGAERVVCNLANEFDKNGWSVDVIVTSDGGPMEKDLRKTVDIIKLSSTRTLASFPYMVRYIQKNRPKALISNLTHINVIAALAVRISRVETSLAVVEHNVLSDRIKQISGNKELLTAKIARYVYPYADAIIAVSDGTADDIAQVTGIDRSAISTVYNPIVSDDLVKQANEPVSHPWFSENIPIILGVGQLSEQKNFSLLIRAFDSVIQKRNARLIIIGEGDDVDKLKLLASELCIDNYVDFLGYVDNPYKYMHHADVFVLSSSWEGFGNVIVEALACGTPVVSTDCESGPAEILENGKWGKLTPVGDAKKMAASIIETLSESTDEDRLRQRATDFSTKSAYREYIELLSLSN